MSDPKDGHPRRGASCNFVTALAPGVRKPRPAVVVRMDGRREDEAYGLGDIFEDGRSIVAIDRTASKKTVYRVARWEGEAIVGPVEYWT